MNVGTRGSQLALAQTNQVCKDLASITNENIDVNIIKTKGDKITNSQLYNMDAKGLFTKELDKALLEEEIDFAAELGVVKMNIVGFDKPTINKSLALSERYDQLYSTIGWHPTEAGSYSQEIEDMIVSQLGNPNVVALGEIGLLLDGRS